jgi:hypothetical protein
LFIPDPGSGFLLFTIPDPGPVVKNAPVLGSGSATLVLFFRLTLKKIVLLFRTAQVPRGKQALWRPRCARQPRQALRALQGKEVRAGARPQEVHRIQEVKRVPAIRRRPVSSSETMSCFAVEICPKKTVSVSDSLVITMVRDRENGAHSDSSEEEEEEVGGEEIDSDSDQVLGKLGLKISVVDPHHRDADPDSTYHPYSDTDS